MPMCNTVNHFKTKIKFCILIITFNTNLIFANELGIQDKYASEFFGYLYNSNFNDASQFVERFGHNLNLNSTDRNNTALIIVSENFDGSKAALDIAEFLILNKININAQDSFGNTALIFASYKQRKYGLTLVKLLLENDADPNIENNDLETALTCAAFEDRLDLFQEILNCKKTSYNTMCYALWKAERNPKMGFDKWGQNVFVENKACALIRKNKKYIENNKCVIL